MTPATSAPAASSDAGVGALEARDEREEVQSWVMPGPGVLERKASVEVAGALRGRRGRLIPNAA